MQLKALFTLLTCSQANTRYQKRLTLKGRLIAYRLLQFLYEAQTPDRAQGPAANGN